jgi:hypothetical protein
MVAGNCGVRCLVALYEPRASRIDRRCAADLLTAHHEMTRPRSHSSWCASRILRIQPLTRAIFLLGLD